MLLPDGTPDVHLRTASGGQKLRNIMLDSNIDLYGPYVTSLLSYYLIILNLILHLKEGVNQYAFLFSIIVFYFFYFIKLKFAG